MMWMHACPRCRGPVVEEWDIYGRFLSCLVCGYILSEQEEYALRWGPPLPAEAT